MDLKKAILNEARKMKANVPQVRKKVEQAKAKNFTHGIEDTYEYGGRKWRAQ